MSFLFVENGADQRRQALAQTDGAFGCLAYRGKRLGQQLLDCFACSQAIAKLLGLAAQFVVAELFEFGFERVDAGRDFAVLLEQAVVATAENLGEKGRGHA